MLEVEYGIRINFFFLKKIRIKFSLTKLPEIVNDWARADSQCPILSDIRPKGTAVPSGQLQIENARLPSTSADEKVLLCSAGTIYTTVPSDTRFKCRFPKRPHARGSSRLLATWTAVRTWRALIRSIYPPRMTCCSLLPHVSLRRQVIISSVDGSSVARVFG